MLNSNGNSQICIVLVIGFTTIVNCLNNVQNILGPSDHSEAYFNGSSYLRLQTTISLKKQTGLSFRTCTGGNLFSQQQTDDLIELSVIPSGLSFFVKTAGKQFEEKILGNFLDNKWHTVQLQYQLGNITLIVDNRSQLIANFTYNHELLTSSGLYNEGAAVLLIGKHFNGCLLEGPSLVFDDTIITSSHNVKFEKCPLPQDSCIPKENIKDYDYCMTEPCMRHGTCINGETTYTCSCLPRYTGKNCEFDIGNPCEKNPKLCKNGGTCIAENSGIKCNCPIGYTGKQCENEILEEKICKNNPCLNGATCFLNGTTIECLCPNGFIGNQCEINIDECLSNPCKNNGICIDGIGNFSCDCTNTGYKGYICDVNINECLSSPCKNNGICFDTYGGYICQCINGYGDLNCQQKITECLSQPCLNNGICQDIPDGYECHCLQGYGGVNCEIKERQRQCDPSTCPPYADCIDNENGLACVCKTEYPGTFPNCAVLDNDNNNICGNNPCQNGGICTPWKGAFNCSCKPGFTGIACDINNFNELTKFHYTDCLNGWTDSNNCGIKCVHEPCEHAINCIDYLGGYYCTCKPGWTGLNCNTKLEFCTNHRCLNGGTCIQHIDFLLCHCSKGFTGKYCQMNIDNCLYTPCFHGGVCVEQGINDFICNCTEQWMGRYCEYPYDVCEHLKPCQNNGSCVKSKNKNDYICYCIHGFEGVNCEINIDDCFNVQCPSGKVCVDLINSYECRCPSGYSGENCTIDSDPCGKDEICYKGSTCLVDPITKDINCICPPGYTGSKCDEDINECKRVGICNEGICVNELGGFQCYCKPGYTGQFCNHDFDECLSMPCQNNATCLNQINNYQCICPPGYEGKDCSINIDECTPKPCMNGSTCIDGINTFKCICQIGMTGTLCEINIDDCASSPCLNGANCIDGLNSYKCNCTDTGYMGEHCNINIDDCLGNSCQNGAICIDDVKDYHCDCHPGYSGKDCEIDINECESNPCKYNGTCLQRSNLNLYNKQQQLLLNITILPKIFYEPFNYSNAAGYECICINGVTGENCEININECESSPCFQGTCIDKIGGYYCECDEGFEGEHCDIDIDECEKFKPCIHGECIDKRANYYCDCEQYYGGKNCNVLLEGCSNKPCYNNGNCKPYLLNETIHKFNCSCLNGFHGDQCEKISTISLSGNNSMVTVNTTREEGYDIQFRFKTTLSDGLLALGKGLTYYILELKSGRLNLHSSLLNKWEGVFIGSNLNNSNWQRVFVAINSTHLVLSANDEQTIYPITFNEHFNTSYTSFPFTYIGGSPNNLRKLSHGQPFLVGCMEDILINGEWVLPEIKNLKYTFHNVEIGCIRNPQCTPNPCAPGGHCTDMWRDFRCTCERPYLGHTCQYTYIPATFGYENIKDSLVTVNVTDVARRAVRTIVEISMFIRTRQSKGQIFYLGSPLINSGSKSSNNILDETTYIAAQLDGGELLVKLQFNGTPEAYTVGGVKLDNGLDHLIEVIRSVTLVQVKLNGREYFRKTISATGPLDAQIMYLGGTPQLRPVRQATNNNNNNNDIILPSTVTAPATTTVTITPLSNIHFKGIIQDVQISNGTSIMVVEFFALQANDLEIPPPFGYVYFDESLVLKGVRSDNTCKINPCHHNGICQDNWNDYLCDCPRGFKGKNCTDQEFCELEECPQGSTCKNLEDGYECLANATFDGRSPPLKYKLQILNNNLTKNLNLNTLELKYRTRSWGTILFVKNNKNYFIIFIYHNKIIVEWNLNKSLIIRHQFKKDQFENEWLTLYFIYKDNIFKGGFKDLVIDEEPNFEETNFDYKTFNDLFTYGTIYIGGSDNSTFDYHNAIEGVNNNNNNNNVNGYLISNDTTTIIPSSINNNNNLLLDSDLYSDDILLFKIDQNKSTDLYKGCLSEIRVGGLLLPFFTKKELYPNNRYSEEYFELVSNIKPPIGCILCYTEDCYNNGFCIDPVETYKCNCTEGYTADDCSIDINECEFNQCQNNATCVDLIAKYRCDCLPGYNGIYCEHDIDECESSPCKHGGTCIDLIGKFQCECPEDFVGRQCEAPLLITCDNKPCKDGSTCKTGPNETTGNNFTCICTDGMEGQYCDRPFCKNQPCQHGICNDTTLIPFCQCDRGYEGKFCEIDIDDCILPTGGSPCQNNGICIDGINRYDCNCTETGYTGLLCENDIDECNIIKDACGENGKCQNMPGTYRCVCEERGKCGHFCILDDPCAINNPCIHGNCVTQCYNQANYICECQDEFTGKNCTDIKVSASHMDGGINVLYIIVPIVLIVIFGLAIGLIVLVNVARSKRATRGTYSPSAQEFCNPRVELDHVLKPPPEERLI